MPRRTPTTGSSPHLDCDRENAIVLHRPPPLREHHDVSRLKTWIDNKFYPDQRSNWDDDLFRKSILKAVTPTSSMLDLGAGAGIVEAMNFRGVAGTVVGVDLDPRVRDNPFLDESAVVDGASLPFEDERFDIVVSDNVLEHLDAPKDVFAEVRRVLKPGGSFIAKTPNKWHYMPTIARVTPTAFHRWVNKRRGRETEDTFPTRYRANTRSAIRRLASETGLHVQSIQLHEGRPEYLRFHPAPYIAGVIYERTVSRIGLLKGLRVVMIAHMVRTP